MMMDWSVNFNEAPKDGTEVDLWLVREDGAGFRLPECKWGKSAWFDGSQGEQWIVLLRDPDETWRDCYHDVSCAYGGNITHFMVPEPPA
jgi:hypothetical protein